MNRVGSPFPTNLFLPQSISTVRIQATELHNLRVQQQLYATIVEVNQSEEEAVLEIGGKTFRTPLNDTMQPGQILQLEVVKTQPALEFKVLGLSKQDQLGQLFSLLSHPYDWSKLGEQIQMLAKDSPDLQSLANLFRQFQQLVSPEAKLPADVAAAVKLLTRQLQNLNTGVPQQEVPKLLPGLEQAFNKPAADPPAAVQNWTRLLSQFKAHVEVGQPLTRAQARGQWYGQTRDLLTQLQTVVRAQTLSPPLVQGLRPLLTQMQKLPVVTPQLARDIRQLDSLVLRMTGRAVMSQDFVAAPSASAGDSGGGGAAVPRESSAGAMPLTAGTPAPGNPETQVPEKLAAQIPGTERSESVEKVVRQLVSLLQTSKESVTLPAKVAGQLEGALIRMVEAGQVAPEHLPYVQTLVQQLKVSPDSFTTVSFREKLGVLSLLLGFSIDKKGAPFDPDRKMSLLQQSLFYLKEPLVGKGDEPLQRLELLQLCREKLAEQQIQFIPLPFSDLEEGYLLVRQHRHQEQDSDHSHTELELSMALRLSAIGSVRVDMLYGPSGLRLQLAGENRQKMHYLEKFAVDLKGALSDVKLVSLNFRDDAKLPTPELKKRVFPEADQLLNMRA